MSARALLIGIDPAEARALTFRDRLIAAGLPLLVLPGLALALWLVLRPPGDSPAMLLAVPAYGMIVTLPALPVVILLSYWFSRRGLIGFLPLAGAGALLGATISAGFALAYALEGAPTADEVLLAVLSWGGLGAIHAAVAWLTLVVLRIDLYFPETGT